MNITIIGRPRAAVVAIAAGVLAFTQILPAQSTTSDSIRTATGSAPLTSYQQDSLRNSRGHFYRRLAAGTVTSILLHEAGHFASAYVMGFHPHFGFDKGRPTAFSGIDEDVDPRQQFIFSAAGLAVQDLLDELVLDIPHHRGGAFERGILAGGLGTTLFYVTVGRNSRVSDISVMARTSHLSKSQLSLIFGSVAAIHGIRVSHNRAYSHFFLAPGDRGTGAKAGLSFRSP